MTELMSMLASTIQDASENPDAGPISMFLATYGLLFASVTGLVEGLKQMIRTGWFDGKEQYAAFLIAPGLGFVAKQYMGFYETTAMWGHMTICILFGATVAGMINDRVFKQAKAFVIPAATTKKGKKKED